VALCQRDQGARRDKHDGERDAAAPRASRGAVALFPGPGRERGGSPKRASTLRGLQGSIDLRSARKGGLTAVRILPRRVLLGDVGAHAAQNPPASLDLPGLLHTRHRDQRGVEKEMEREGQRKAAMLVSRRRAPAHVGGRTYALPVRLLRVRLEAVARRDRLRSTAPRIEEEQDREHAAARARDARCQRTARGGSQNTTPGRTLQSRAHATERGPTTHGPLSHLDLRWRRATQLEPTNQGGHEHCVHPCKSLLA